MSEILLHSSTKAAVESFIANPAHALLIEGPAGIGKTYLATYISSQSLGISHSKISSFAYFWMVKSEKGISIEQIRDLQKNFMLKIPGTEQIRRVAVIEHSENMTIEAQNALLKLLEEPPKDSLIILTTSNKNRLLPTIVSRTRQLVVSRPTRSQMHLHYGELDILKIATGLPGLANSLAGDSKHPLISAIDTAKSILASQQYDRLLLVTDLSKDKQKANELIQGLIVVCQAALEQTASMRWHKALKASLFAQESLNKNANTKLVLTNLMLSL